MENKQTAVEWLIEKLQNRQNGIFKGIHYMSLDEIYDLAKAIENQQHKNTWFDSTAQFDNAAEMTYKKTFEQYHNETYGKY